MRLERAARLVRSHWDVGAITVLALAVRLVHLDTLRYADDYFHILAAQNWLREGTLGIAGGEPYGRASAFTYLVAGFMQLFGETRWAARLPAALAGAALVGVLFAWVRAVAGRTAAWVAALFLAFDVRWGISLSQIVRFYTLHSLAYFLGAIAVYHLAVRRLSWPASPLLLAGAAVAFALAYHLQISTVVGLIALTVWLAVELGPRAVRYVVHQPRIGAVWAGGTVLLGAVVVLVLMKGGTAAVWWNVFQSVPSHAVEYQDELGYYVRRLSRAHPVFWGVFPVAIVVAIARAGRPAVFSAILFSIPFVLHSVAAFKADRYIAYAVPFFFAVWGMALAAIAPALARAAREALVTILTVRPPPLLLRIGSWVLLVAVFGAMAFRTRPFSETYDRITPGVLRQQLRQPNWAIAAPHLANEVASAAVVVGSGADVLYYLGRADVLVGEPLMPGGDSMRQFAQARQLGRPVVTTGDALETLFRCYRSGLVAIGDHVWGVDWGFSEDLVQVIVARGEPIPLPEHANIHAYRWTDGGEAEATAACPAVGRGTPTM